MSWIYGSGRHSILIPILKCFRQIDCGIGSLALFAGEDMNLDSGLFEYYGAPM